MAIRKFKFDGFVGAGDTSARITINGIEVHNGYFTNEINVPDDILVSGEIDIAETTQASKPVSVTVNSGLLGVGMIRWAGTSIRNPIYSDEQWANLNSTSSKADRLSIYNLLASPALSTEEMNTLLVSDDRAERRTILTAHNLLKWIPDFEEFGYGPTPELAADNRDNMLLDGVEPENHDTHMPVMVPAGSTLVFDAVVFGTSY